MPPKPSQPGVDQGRAGAPYFDDVTRPFKSISKATEPTPTYLCPCCHCKTLCGRARDEICQVCYWHDDGQDEHDAEEVRGGHNGTLSLRQAQSNFLEYGASDRRFIGGVDSAISPTGDDDGRYLRDIDWETGTSHRRHPHQIRGLGKIAGLCGMVLRSGIELRAD
jgi:hypothetical protein